MTYDVINTSVFTPLPKGRHDTHTNLRSVDVLNDKLDVLPPNYSDSLEVTLVVVYLYTADG